MQQQDQLFFRVALLFLVLIVLLFVFFILARWVTPDNTAGTAYQASKVAELTQPVGTLAVAGEVDEAVEAIEEVAVIDKKVTASAAADGEAIYNSLCIACHSVAGIGAPVLGNAADWSARIAKGVDVLYQNAIDGYVGPEGFMMPARGGGNFSDEEVKAAVDYMIDKSR